MDVFRENVAKNKEKSTQRYYYDDEDDYEYSGNSKDHNNTKYTGDVYEEDIETINKYFPTNITFAEHKKTITVGKTIGFINRNFNSLENINLGRVIEHDNTIQHITSTIMDTLVKSTYDIPNESSSYADLNNINTDLTGFFDAYEKINKFICAVSEIDHVTKSIYDLIEQYKSKIDLLLDNIGKINKGYLAFTVNLDTDFVDFIKYVQLSIEINRLKRVYTSLLNRNFKQIDTRDSSTYDISDIINYILEPPTYEKIDDNYVVSITQFMFEFAFGNYVRQDQINLIQTIYDSIITKKNLNDFHQLLMGKGKSSVIAPLVSLYLLSNPSIQRVFIVMPQSLIDSMKTNLLKILNGFINVTINIANIDRFTNQDVIDDILTSHNTIHLIDDASIKSLKLDTVIKTNSYKVNNMDSTAVIFDEIDDMIDPLKSELNYVDKTTNMDISYTNNIRFIYTLLYTLFKSPTYDTFRKSYPKFNLIPHIHLTNKDDFDDLSQQAEFKQIIKEACVVAYIGLKLTDEIINDIILNKPSADININFMRQYIHKILKTALTNIHRRHFGLVDEFPSDGICKYNYIAVPYFALNKPSKKSEFSSIELTITFTIISYFDENSHKIRHDDINMYVMHLLKQAQKLGTKYINFTEYAQTYANMFKDIDTKPSFMTQYKNFTITKDMYDSVKINSELTESYILDVIIPKFIKLSEFVSNISMIDIVSSTFCKNRTGFSGTPYFENPVDLHRKYKMGKINMDIVNEGAIKSAILGTVTTKPKLFGIDEIVLDDIVEFIMENNYLCMIDIGCLFISFTTIEIVKVLADKFSATKSNIKAVVYINSNHIKMYMDTITKVIAPIDKNPYSLQDTFVFFDQTHIIGQDIVLSSVATGLVTFNYFTTYRDIAQGIYRLRNLNFGQSIDYVGYNKLIHTLFPSYISALYPNYNKFTNFDPMDLLQWCISLNYKYAQLQSPSYYVQNIKYLLRETALRLQYKSHLEYFNKSPYTQPNFSDISTPYTELSFMDDMKKILYDEHMHFSENVHLFNELKSLFGKYDSVKFNSGLIQTNIIENEVIVERMSINSTVNSNQSSALLETAYGIVYLNDIFSQNTEKLIPIDNPHSLYPMYYTQSSQNAYNKLVSEQRRIFSYIIFIQRESTYAICLRNNESYVLQQFLKSTVTKELLSGIKSITITTMHGTIVYEKSVDGKKKNKLKNDYIICLLNALLFFDKDIMDENTVMQLIEYSKVTNNEDKILNYIRSNFNHYPFNIFTIDLFNIPLQTLYHSIKFIQCLSRVYKHMLKLHLIQRIDVKINELTHKKIHNIIFNILNPSNLTDTVYNDMNKGNETIIEEKVHICKNMLKSELAYIQSMNRGKIYYKYIIGYNIIFSQNNPSQIKDKDTINSIFETFHDMMNMKDEFYSQLVLKLLDIK